MDERILFFSIEYYERKIMAVRIWVFMRERVFCLNPTVKYRSTLNAIRLEEHNARRPLCFHCVTFNTHASVYTWYVKQVNTAVNIYIFIYTIFNKRRIILRFFDFKI
jgi:hypothetical protein